MKGKSIKGKSIENIRLQLEKCKENFSPNLAIVFSAVAHDLDKLAENCISSVIHDRPAIGNGFKLQLGYFSLSFAW